MCQNNSSSKLAFARLRDPLVSVDEPRSSVSSDKRKGVQSVDLAFQILSAFEKANGPMAIKELVEELKMPASKIHHYLVSLVRSGVLRQSVDGTYDLGPFALHLGLSAMRKLEPIERAAAAARLLRDKTGEAVFISVWGSHGPTIIRYYEGIQPVTVEVRAGLVLPLASSATGRVYLTWGNDSTLTGAVKREKLPKSEVQRLKKSTLKDGLGSVEGDLLPRIASLSAPVFDRDARLTLAITVLGWVGELDSNLAGPLAHDLREAANQLSSELGHQPE